MKETRLHFLIYGIAFLFLFVALPSLAVSVAALPAQESNLFQSEGRGADEFCSEAAAASVSAAPVPRGVVDTAGVAPTPMKIGLVLSGGGAKGIAHVGIIKALEENNIPIDYVTGTSMGAIVGSLYACGWSPEKMIKFFTSPDFKYWSSGTINKDMTYYISDPRPTPQWVGVHLNLNDSTGFADQILPSNLISPIPMNIEFLRVYGAYTEQCKENFDNLFVPFRCVTSDVYHKRKIVLKNGSLSDAVRASMSFPFVFRPITMDGVLVYDGGIYDNFPVDVMEQDFNPDFIIGVSVASPDKKPKLGDVYSQLEDMIIQNNNYSVPADKGIKIQVPVLQYGVLDFAAAQTIYDIGYHTGLSMVDSIKSRIDVRRDVAVVDARRRLFAAYTPELTFDSVSVVGATGEKARYLQYIFEKREGDKISIDQVENSYYLAVTDGTLSNLLPQARFNSNGRNMLILDATLKRPWSVGLGGWITSSTNSMLYLDLGYHTLSFNSLDMNVSGWVGQSYYAGMFNMKFNMRSHVPAYLQFEAVTSKQKFYDSELLFYENSTPTFISEVENYARFRFVRAAGKRAKFQVGLGYSYMSDSYYPANQMLRFSLDNKDLTQYHVGAFRLGFDGNSLNDQLYPNQGLEWFTNLIVTYEMSRYLPGGDKEFRTTYSGYSRGSLEAYWKQFFPVAKNVTLGLAANALGTLQHLRQNYTATLIHAPAFAPTPSTRNYFNTAFRSDNYVAVGMIPVWSPLSRTQIRGDFYVYSPIRNLEQGPQGEAYYNGWFRRHEFLGEVAAVYNFPFASLSIYANYLSYPSNNWNFGINFGLLFQAPKFLR